MSLPAAPEAVGRRLAFGTAFLVVAYVVVAPPLFLLGPLFLLLAFSRPRSWREWLWLVLAAAASVRLAVDPDAFATLPSRVIVAGAATVSGAFLVLCYLLGASSTTTRTLMAVTVTTAALLGWARVGGIEIAELDQAVLAEMTRSVRILLRGSPAAEVEGAMVLVGHVSRLFPGVLVLQALAGLSLAWIWYQRVARHPLPPGPARLRDFAFNDHLIWGAVLTLALAVFPVGDSFSRAAENALVVWGGLYAARGLAVGWSAIQNWPVPGQLLIVTFAILTFPVAIGTMITLGLADTWFDFRGRRRAPEEGDIDAR